MLKSYQIAARKEQPARSQGDAQENTPLFRNEPIKQRQTQWLGTVLLEPQISTTLLTWAALASAAGIISLLTFGSYTRKAQLDGFIMPEKGLVRLFSPVAATVTGLNVSEGQVVKQGDVLLTFTNTVATETAGDTADEIVKSVNAKRDTTLKTKRDQEKVFAQKRDALEDQKSGLEQQADALDAQITLQNEQLKITRATLARETEMRADDIIPVSRLQRTKGELIDVQTRIANLRRERANLDNELAQVSNQLAEIPLQRNEAIAGIDQNLSSIDQELIDAEARRSSAVKAPQDGIVTAVAAEVGGSIFQNTPVMSLVPQGSDLQVQLYGASRAIGFVTKGQRVSLRYQPYSYQKYGTYGGTVIDIARTPVNLSELPFTFRTLNQSTEPMFKVTVKLDSQRVNAFGNDLPLQAGMQVEADVAVEKRKLYEWVLDPLYSITRKAVP